MNCELCVGARVTLIGPRLPGGKASGIVFKVSDGIARLRMDRDGSTAIVYDDLGFSSAVINYIHHCVVVGRERMVAA